MKYENQIVKCGSCRCNDLNTKEMKDILFTKSTGFYCPICRSIKASPRQDIQNKLSIADDGEIKDISDVYYNKRSGRYHHYRTGCIVRISTTDGKIFVRRASLVNWIKSGNVFSMPGLTYSESVSFLLKKKGSAMFLDQFNGLTTSYEGARAFLSAKKARGHLRTIEDFDPKEWMAVRCETQFLMVSKE